MTQLYTNISNNQLYIKIKNDFEIKRQPSNIIAVLDVSGSMNENASKNMKENDQLSRLDLLKHVCLTTINLLDENDTFGIITFSTDAKILQNNIYMTADNKKKASDIINSLMTEGTTNIYDGLSKSINLLNSIDNNNNNSIILLTDGVSNVNPPAGIVNTFKRYVSTLKLKSYNLNTFGFSDCVDSKLLREISDYGNGVYGFIPDASMVGTCFINYISSVLTTIFSNINIEIVYDNDEIQYENTGAVLLEQDRELLIKLKSNNVKNILLKCNDKTFDIPNIISNDVPIKTIIRYDIINTISNLIENGGNNYKSILEDLYLNIKSKITDIDKEYITNYLNDYLNDGQISVAFSKEYINTWGLHYLLSLLRSYNMQICLNFKDNGLQNYANKLFSKLRDEGEVIFLSIPPPVRKNRYTGAVRQSVNMTAFYNQSGGCFDGNSDIKMYNNTYKKVKNLTKGDEVLSINNLKAKIECIIITKINKEHIQMCNINEMLITPYHPVIYNNKWVYPINVVKPKNIKIELVYNLVLSNGHIVYLNNTPVVTLGENNVIDINIRHSYLNSNNVINDLSNKVDYNNGVVVLEENDFIRDSITNEIIRIN
jgi:hypothetical protein